MVTTENKKEFIEWFKDNYTFKRREKLLEEYADCLHLAISIGLEIGIDVNVEFDSNKYFEEGIMVAFNETFLTVGLYYMRKSPYRNLLEMILTLGYVLGFTEEEIEQSFMRKTEISYQRQNNGY